MIAIMFCGAVATQHYEAQTMLSIASRTGVLLSAIVLSLTAPVQAQTRLVETSFGDVEVPTDPSRIVATHTVAALPLVELGFVPVGTRAFTENQTALDVWERVKDLPVVIAGGEANIEAIAALEPDLIFETNAAPDDVVEKLRQIAPVVIVGVRGADRSDWQNRAYQIADAVGALERWQDLEDELAERQARIANRCSDFLAEHPIAVWSSWDATAPAIYASQSTAGSVLLPTGAIFADGVEAVPYEDSEPQISLEQIGPVLGDAAIVFHSTDHRDTPVAPVAEIRALDIYQRVPAVAQGREFPIGTVAIAGYTNAFYLLDSFEAALEELSAEIE